MHGGAGDREVPGRAWALKDGDQGIKGTKGTREREPGQRRRDQGRRLSGTGAIQHVTATGRLENARSRIATA
jgi:hypothetical protein